MCVAPESLAQPTARRRSTIVEDQLRKHKKSFQSFRFVRLTIITPAKQATEGFDKLTNPLSLSREYYWCGWALKCLGLQLLDHIVLVLLERAYNNKMMMYRINTGNRGLVKLEWIDYLFLCINSVVEWQFTCHVIDIVLSSPNFAWRLSDLGLLNTLPALYLIFAIDDAFYAPLHLLMHRPWFYPYVHKHHHRQQPTGTGLRRRRQRAPDRTGAWFIVFITLVIVGHVTNVHALTIFVHFILYAVLGAFLNHTAYDVQFAFWGFEYTTRAHETHSTAIFRPNLAQYFMFWDKLYLQKGRLWTGRTGRGGRQWHVCAIVAWSRRRINAAGTLHAQRDEALLIFLLQTRVDDRLRDGVDRHRRLQETVEQRRREARHEARHRPSYSKRVGQRCHDRRQRDRVARLGMPRPVDRARLHDDGAAAQGEGPKRFESVPLAQRITLRYFIEPRWHRRADDDGAFNFALHGGLEDGHVRGAAGLARGFDITGDRRAPHAHGGGRGALEGVQGLFVEAVSGPPLDLVGEGGAVARRGAAPRHADKLHRRHRGEPLEDFAADEAVAAEDDDLF